MGQKLNLNSTSQLKTACDENLPIALAQLGFAEDFTLVDTRIGLGLFTVACAGVLFYVDKKMEWNEAYWYTVGLIALYFVGNVVLWFFTNAKSYKNVVYTGTNDAKAKLSVRTTTEKYNPVYRVQLALDGSEAESSIEFTKLFDSFATLHQSELVSFLKKEVDKVSKKKQ